MNRKVLPSLISIGLASLAMGGQVFAQDQSAGQDDEGQDVLEEVVVTGVRYSLTQAVDLKRESMDIVDSIVSEDLGKFPDNNVVESMQRIPGVQVTDRGAGEVSVVSIRGLSEVTTTLNGRNIFTASGRSVALQDIPATLVNRVDVYKTRSAEHIARGIAGQIDIHTNRPFDLEKGFRLLTQVRAVHQDQADETNPHIAALISNRWDGAAGEFGALFNVS